VDRFLPTDALALKPAHGTNALSVVNAR